eukprot:2829852-Prymnesium_polylepis.2
MLQPAAAGPQRGYGGMPSHRVLGPKYPRHPPGHAAARRSEVREMPAPSIAKLVVIGTLRKMSWGGEPEATSPRRD